jgi:hypothetical protein
MRIIIYYSVNDLNTEHCFRVGGKNFQYIVEMMVVALGETCLITKEGITRGFHKKIMLTKNSIYFVRLCHLQEFHVTPEDGIVCHSFCETT